MVTLTREDVGRVARALITLNRSTTTLDVKLALRNLGFFATQDEVRNYMLDITSNDGDIVYADAGLGYRTYSFRTPTVRVTDLTTAQPTTTTTPAPVVGVVTVTTASLHRDDRPANYVVTDRWGGFQRKYVNVSRSQAKRKWEVDTGMPYASARTIKQD